MEISLRSFLHLLLSPLCIHPLLHFNPTASTFSQAIMKIAILLAAIAQVALAIPPDYLSSRQVNTTELRAGTRRLRARQAGPSPVAVFSLSRYANCPLAVASDEYYFDRVQINKWAAPSTTNADQLTCFYKGIDLGDTARCYYSSEDGMLCMVYSSWRISFIAKLLAYPMQVNRFCRAKQR